MPDYSFTTHLLDVAAANAAAANQASFTTQALGPPGPAGTGGGGGLSDVLTTVTTTATATIGQHNPADATSGAFTVTLPNPTTAGQMISVEKTDSTANAVTVSGHIRSGSTSTISLTLAHETVLFVAKTDLTWWPVAGHKTLSSLDARYTIPLLGGAEQLDYACDLSAAATTIDTSGASLDVAGGLGISCPATGTNRSLIVRCGGAFQITTAGAGTLALQIYETTAGGAAVLIGVSQVAGTFTVGTGSAFPSAATVAYDLGPTTTDRQFKLMCAMIRDSASTLAAKVRSSSTGVVKAWIEGVAM